MTEEEYSKVEKQRAEEAAQNNNPQVVPIPQNNLTPQDVPEFQEEAPAHLVAQLSPVAVLFEKSIEIYKANFGKMIGMVLLPFLGIIAIVLVAVVFLFLSGSLNSINSVGLMGGMTLIVGLLLFMAVIGVFYVYIVTRGGLFVLVKDSSKNLSIKQAFNEGKKYAVDIWIIGIVSALFVLLWSMLLIIPGIVASLNYSLALWVYMYEGFTGSKALARSKELIKGYWWAVFGRFMAVVGVYYVIAMILGVLSKIDSGMEIVFTILDQLVGLAFGPFVIIYSCFIYWDLRKIKGGTTIKNKKSSRSGTIILLSLLTIVIIGLLSAISVASLRSAQEKAKGARVLTDLNSLRTGVEMYRADYGKLPNNLIEVE